jgi:hypothetical protein
MYVRNLNEKIQVEGNKFITIKCFLLKKSFIKSLITTLCFISLEMKQGLFYLCSTFGEVIDLKMQVS